MTNDQIIRLEAVRLSSCQGSPNLKLAAELYAFLKGDLAKPSRKGK